MKTNSPKINWLMDAGLFAFLLASFWLDLTGLFLHQWLGLVLAAGVGFHLLAHWSWVKSVTRRFFGHTSGQARLFYLIDVSLLLSLTLTGVTGLVISTWLGLDLANYATWKNLHVVSSLFVLLAVVLKIGLHWRWIVKVAGRTIFAPRSIHAFPVAPQLAAVPVDSGRRDFIRLMGVVSAAALVSFAHMLDSDEQTFASASADGQDSSNLAFVSQTTSSEIVQAESSLTASAEELDSSAPSSTTLEAQTGALEAENDASTPLSSSLLSASATQCRVECNRRCSYPGHCRRYVDSNGNNRCDHGECI